MYFCSIFFHEPELTLKKMKSVFKGIYNEIFTYLFKETECMENNTNGIILFRWLSALLMVSFLFNELCVHVCV